MSKAKLVVVGSSNVDMVIKTDSIPRGGETVLGSDFVMVPGGKGANQAVCAAKLGAEVHLVARIGTDVFGDMSLASFKDVKIDTTHITRDADSPNGVALVSVDKDGENAIVVAPGANHRLLVEDVERAASDIENADCVVLQLEIPPEVVEYTIGIARKVGTRVVMNPAPIRSFDKGLIGFVDVLVPNQHEAAELVGKRGKGEKIDGMKAAKKLVEMGAGAAIVTMGSQGACAACEEVCEQIDARKVDAVDTTAAGDAFTASVAVSVAEGKPIIDAARFAAKVASVVVTRMGAQSSMPARAEVEAL